MAGQTRGRTKEAAAAEKRLLKLAAWFLGRAEPATRSEIQAAFPRDYVGQADAVEKKWTRDKRDLLRLGIPIRFIDTLDDRGAYTVDAGGYHLPALEFAPEEAAVLWMAGQAALRSPEHPLRDELETALRKLAVGAKGLPPRAAMLEAEGTREGDARLRKWLETLADAVERRKRVRLSYAKSSGEVGERLVDPYGYAWRRGEWLLVGYCHLRRALRVFYLGRVQALALAPLEAKKEDFRIPEDFDIRAWSRQEPWDYLVHEPREARIRFRGSLARIASRLLPGVRLTTAPGGVREARLPVRNLAGLVRQAIAWGPEAEVVEPADARQLARELLAGLQGRLGAEVAP
jgi:proteasome accessory factor B